MIPAHRLLTLEIRRHVRRAGTAFLDLLLPPTCLSCGGETGTAQGLCVSCWSAIRFFGSPSCARCGLPFDWDAGADALCAACIGVESHIDRLRAVFAYDDASRHLILSFKHGDRLHALAAFGRWLARSAVPLIEAKTIIVPVPLHWTRLFERRYNQSALLARALAEALQETDDRKPKVIPDLLRRRRRTLPQGRLGRRSRSGNVQGAFVLNAGVDVRDCPVLLIDDVLTTGATVEECARVLKRAGAARVDVLTLARRLRVDA